MVADVAFDADRMFLTWTATGQIPAAPIIKGCELDFFRRERDRENNIAGPFLAFRQPAAVRLRSGAPE
jgi:hypothetical protein